ncbi:unnamed protein product [Pylaiella littoralis]
MGFATIFKASLVAFHLQWVTGAAVDNILEDHNAYRCMHNATALTYSASLETAAQVWTDNLATNMCGDFEHDPGLGDVGHGENLFQCAGTDCASGGVAITDWYNEVEFYVPGETGTTTDPSDPFIQILHFTQVVWKDTQEVGCASSSCVTVPGVPYTYVACRYTPPGNYRNQYLLNVEGTASQTEDVCRGGGGPQPTPAPVMATTPSHPPTPVPAIATTPPSPIEGSTCFGLGIPGIEGSNRNGDVCCPLGCTQCGGSNCEFAGSAADLSRRQCCINGVLRWDGAGYCSETMTAPCKLNAPTPAPISPAPTPVPPPAPTLAPTPAPIEGSTCFGLDIPGIEGSNSNGAVCCPLGCNQCGGSNCPWSGSAAGLTRRQCCINGVLRSGGAGDCSVTMTAPCIGS